MVGNNKGQAMVEFALVLPILILILTGMLEFGLILHAYLGINHAAREGARLASLGGTDAQITLEVQSNLPTLDLARLTVTVTPATRVRGQDAVVAMTYNHQTLIPLIGNIIGEGVPLRAQVAMRVE
ncbi:TadE family protein [Anaerotalea alkaliphila]|uniref:Pilus assembly protein n=1 Tax=Anaerotalea alkaliphila TaxID=2662126 RepID=A0A7X5KLX8_9FIRM|nr:TadE/TadG family type IV pilus assembly protein [Anaerotalea alkaliphila]NDL67336.1 pilus assembly protein [Anaerotalea alkaliphila]